MGIFPWYDESQPILWHAPDPRTVLVPSELRITRSLRRTIKSEVFDVTVDTDFGRVIRACAAAPRKAGDGTWITSEMIDAYEQLFELGYAHSVETRQGEELVGGLYGVSLGGCFFGESMFALRSDASKVAFVTLIAQLERWSFDLVDCQIHSDHLARFGAHEWARSRFSVELERSLRKPTCRGPWCFDGETRT